MGKGEGEIACRLHDGRDTATTADYDDDFAHLAAGERKLLTH